MSKIFKACIIFISLCFSIESFAHTGHYVKLKALKFELLRDQQSVGYHDILFEWKGDELIVKNIIEFKIKILGIPFYQYSSQGTERYHRNGDLISFNSSTNENGEKKFCNIEKKIQNYKIDGTKFKGEVNADFAIAAYWTHEILTKKKLVSGITCRMIEVDINYLKEETIKINNQSIVATVFDIKGKDLNTQVWFDKKDRYLLHQVLNKNGIWDYKLKEIKLDP
jgi:hypothetical protein